MQQSQGRRKNGHPSPPKSSDSICRIFLSSSSRDHFKDFWFAPASEPGKTRERGVSPDHSFHTKLTFLPDSVNHLSTSAGRSSTGCPLVTESHVSPTLSWFFSLQTEQLLAVVSGWLTCMSLIVQPGLIAVKVMQLSVQSLSG